MRLLIFIGIIAGLVYFSSRVYTGKSDGALTLGLSKFTAGALTSPLRPIVDTATKSAQTTQSPIAPAPATHLSPFSSAEKSVIPEIVPNVFARYQFRYRQSPSDEDLAKYTSYGVVCIGDRVSRVVIVRGPQADVDSVISHLASTDQVPGACVARSWVVFVESTRTEGWDLTAAIQSIAVPQTYSAAVGVAGGLLNLSSGDVSAALGIIASNGDVSVLQRPHLTLSDGVESILESIREVPIPSVTLTNGFSQSSVTYRKIGLQLHITPRFLHGDRISLAVKQDNGLIGPNALVSGHTVPTFDTQSLSTVVEMSIGQCVVLGGVASERVEKTSGFLGSREEIRRGALYVVLSTESELPRALPISPMSFPRPSSISDVPFSGGTGVLPPKSWKSIFE